MMKLINVLKRCFKLNKKIKIGPPENVVHCVHVTLNSLTGKFEGLPEEWEQILFEEQFSTLITPYDFVEFRNSWCSLDERAIVWSRLDQLLNGCKE